MMYDFMLDFSDCTERFADFDEMVDACEAIDAECSPNHDTQDVTFYDFAFGLDYRQKFCAESMNKGLDFKDIALHQIKVQQAFRNAMSHW